ncbi:MAG: DUF4174 domain-containing protein [Saprospiraceae bacterium]|nr:DUF4174 domain-containing protein [Saprospiraceae bacterium]
MILLFSESTNSTKLIQQLDIFRGNESGFKERKLKVLELIGTEFDPKLEIYKSNSNESQRMKSPFEFVLIGLDGTIKMRSNDPVEMNRLFQLIDSMPMRRIELKNY